MRSSVWYRVILGALMVVLVALTAYSVVVSRQTRVELDTIDTSLELSEAYRDANEALTDTEVFMLRRQMTGAGSQEEFEAMVRRAQDALARIALTGSEQDRQVVAGFIEIASPALTSARDYLANGGSLDASDASPDLISALKSAVREPARTRATEAKETITRVSDELRYDLAAAFGVFAVGALVVFGLIVLLRHFGQRALATRIELDHLRRAVLQDSLTLLGNQRAFEEDLQRLLADAGATGRPLAMALLDVDDFKVTNDTWGHERGDEVLRAVAATLMELRSPGAIAYRVGGDEFSVIFPDTGAETAFGAMDAVRLAVMARAGCTVSVGLAATMPPEPVADGLLLRQQADAAMYDAKGRGRNLVRVYEPFADVIPLFPAAKVEGFRALISSQSIPLALQPIWSLGTGELLACEVLARPDPKFGLTPAEAFQVAERIGRAPELDQLCIRSLVGRASTLPAEGLLFINLSPATLVHAAFSVESFTGALVKAGIPLSRVVVEITERTTVPMALIASYLEPLRVAGVRIALDDVGSGNAGLEFLRNIPVDFVKVDRSVVVAAQAGRAARAVLTGILAFAAESNSSVIAEGIDQPSMLEFLRVLSSEDALRPVPRVDAVQGFLLGVPATVPSLRTPHQLGEDATDVA